MSLTAGDWDVWGNIRFSADQLSAAVVAVNTTSAALPSGGQGMQLITWSDGTDGANPTQIATGTIHLKFATTTTVYLVAEVSFVSASSGTMSCALSARRMR